MALRPLDNALPIPPPDRPKKQAKVAAPMIMMEKQQQHTDVVVVNDENQAPLLPHPSSGDAAVDYIPSENLTALLDPGLKIQVLRIPWFVNYASRLFGEFPQWAALLFSDKRDCSGCPVTVSEP